MLDGRNFLLGGVVVQDFGLGDGHEWGGIQGSCGFSGGD